MVYQQKEHNTWDVHPFIHVWTSIFSPLRVKKPNLGTAEASLFAGKKADVLNSWREDHQQWLFILVVDVSGRVGFIKSADEEDWLKKSDWLAENWVQRWKPFGKAA